MKNCILLLMFIAYTTSIFFISSIYALAIFFIINIALISMFKIPLERVFINLYKFSFVVFITFIFNILFGYYKDAILISIRLVLVCNISFIFTYTMGFNRIISALEMLFYPLKLLGISPSDLSLIINIAITFIPIFIRDINQTLFSMQNKGLKKYSLKSLKYTSKIILLWNTAITSRRQKEKEILLRCL